MYFPILLLLLNYFHVDWLRLLLPPSVWSSVDVLDYHQHQVSPWHSNLYWSRVNCDHTTSSSHHQLNCTFIRQLVCCLRQSLSYIRHLTNWFRFRWKLTPNEINRFQKSFQNPKPQWQFFLHMTLDVLAISINFTTWVIPD